MKEKLDERKTQKKSREIQFFKIRMRQRKIKKKTRLIRKF